MPMRIRVNGQIVEAVPSLTVAALLAELGYENQMVAVAINETCIPRQSFGQQTLKDSDSVEILAPMAGG